MLTLLGYAAAAMGFLALLWVVGWPLATALRSHAVPFPAPLLGLCLVPIFAWYWVDLTGTGLRAGIWVLAGVSAAGCVAVAIRRRAALDVRSALVQFATVTAATVIVCLTVFYPVLATPYLTTFSTLNNDASAWLAHAQHLLDDGLRIPTAFSGYDFPTSFRLEATFGAVSLLASAAAITGLDTWQIGGFVICVFVGLVMLALSAFIQHVTGLSVVPATAIAAASTTPALFLYSAANFFFGHVAVLAIVPMVALLAFELTRRHSIAALAPCVLALALAVAMVLCSYAPATLALVVVVAAAGTATVTAPPRLPRAGRFVAAALASVVLAAALLPQLAVWAFHRLRLLSGGKWGWELSTFLPHELLGFASGLMSSASVAGWLVSLLILGVVAFVAFRHRSVGDFAVPGLFLVVGILLSYGVMTWHFGRGHYNAWKWIAYFQPLFCAAVYSLLALGIKDVKPTSYARIVGAVGVLATVLALAFTARTFTEPDAAEIGFGVGDDPRYQTVPQSIETFPAVAARAGIREVNIDLPPHWETVWAWYGLREVRAYPLRPSWLAPVGPQAPWDLRRVDAGDALTGPRVVPIDGTYQFVEHSTDPPSDAPGGLDADLTLLSQAVTASDRVLLLRATNTGKRCWLVAGKRQPMHGAVTLRASLLTGDGAVADEAFRRKPLPTGSCVGSGWSLDLTLKVPREEHRTLRLQLDAQGVQRFGEVLDVGYRPADSGSRAG